MFSRKRTLISLILISVFLITCAQPVNGAATFKNIPGLVIGLFHTGHQAEPDIIPGNLRHYGNFDLGADEGVGFSWWMVKDNPDADPVDWEEDLLPPGLVFGLKHSVLQADDDTITVFGEDPINGPSRIADGYLRKAHGGDLGASRGEGFYWYESVNPSFSNWDKAEKELPIGTVFGLMHSSNRPKTFKWRDSELNAQACYENGDTPYCWEPRNGGDEGGSEGEGYYWFEKVR